MLVSGILNVQHFPYGKCQKSGRPYSPAPSVSAAPSPPACCRSAASSAKRRSPASINCAASVLRSDFWLAAMVVSRKSTESGRSSVAFVRPSARADLRSAGFAPMRTRRNFAAEASDGLADMTRDPFDGFAFIRRCGTGTLRLSARLQSRLYRCPHIRTGSRPLIGISGRVSECQIVRVLDIWNSRMLCT